MSDRQRILDNNRSLRNIKSELEKLLEGGVITDDVFDAINNLLPAESPLSGIARPWPSVAPAATSTTDSLSSRLAPPTAALAQMHRDVKEATPPAYSPAAFPPALPARAASTTPRPKKPVLVKARALYPYRAADSRDVALEPNDIVDVFDYVNNEWWMGQNTRTGLEGIFPSNYVQAEQEVEKNANRNSSSSPFSSNPYSSAFSSLPPPMQVAQTGRIGGPPIAQKAFNALGDNDKLKQHGSKFGKKLGDAAIFGAGAAIGSTIVGGLL